jgi:ectoine hydroxylase-related dioxygenase (phytanoyl-CoA dioxygenase family)
MRNIHAGGPIPALNYRPLPTEEAGSDILKQYPRIIHPHKVNDTAMRYMLHPKLMAVLATLFDEEPLAAQSMFYFKPPGARGQSLHQDNFFLKVEPGTCIAAWIALDPADQENGGLVVAPKTNRLDIQCPHAADTRIFFTNEEVDIPEGTSPIPINLNSGDVLFFNGSIIHGSYPNTSKDRWRRTFICHYVGGSTLRIGSFYNELYKANGEMVKREENTDAGPCGSVSNQPH